MCLICIVALISCIIISQKTYHKYLNPLNLFIGMNLLSLILMFGCSILDDDISLNLWIDIIIMLLAFLIGTILAKKKITFGNSRKFVTRVTDFRRLRRLIIIYSIAFDIFAFYYLIQLHQYIGLGNIFSRLSDLNIAIQSEAVDFGVSNLFTPIGVPLSLMILFYMKWKRANLILWIQYFLCFIPCISPRRDMLFFMISVTFCYILTQNVSTRKIDEKISKRIKKGIIGGLLVIMAIGIMGYTQNLMNKSTELSFTVFGINIPDGFKDGILYIAGNYPYLERINEGGQLCFELPLISTFRLLYRYIFSPLGITIDTDSIFALPFYNIGFNTAISFNTAPMLYYVIKEAGVLFPIFFICLGMLSRKAFRYTEKHDSIGSIMLGIFLYDILLFSFRSYNLIYLSYLLTLMYILFAFYYIEKRTYCKK